MVQLLTLAKNMETKTSIRKKIKSIVSSINDRSYQAEAVCKKLITIINEVECENILVFMPLQDEINISYFVNYLLSENKNVFVPVSYDNGLMKFYKLTDLNNLKTGKYGISVPDNNCLYKYNPFDIIIVPGIAFDYSLNRMGRGKGYYDIFLSNHSLKKIGVCFNEQLIDHLPSEEHDIKMDMIVTEKRILKNSLL